MDVLLSKKAKERNILNTQNIEKLNQYRTAIWKRPVGNLIIRAMVQSIY